MSRFAYVNGRYVARADAAVDVEDRGYQFADGVYEVIGVTRGQPVDLEPHLERLERSLAELRIPWPCGRAALRLVIRQVVRRNRLADGIVYLQVTRGAAPRNHAFPPEGTRPALVITAAPRRPPDEALAARGIAVITLPDNRWGRPDIKTVSLLPNVLARQHAREAGAYEAWFVDAGGHVTEGSSTNAWIVTADREVVTRPLGREILAGITREMVIRAAREGNFRLSERPFTVEEAKSAREAFITSTTSFVLPVTTVDGETVGDGTPGPVTQALLDAYRRRFYHGSETSRRTGEGA
jgi:D-alanine transaminase